MIYAIGYNPADKTYRILESEGPGWTLSEGIHDPSPDFWAIYEAGRRAGIWRYIVTVKEV